MKMFRSTATPKTFTVRPGTLMRMAVLGVATPMLMVLTACSSSDSSQVASLGSSSAAPSESASSSANQADAQLAFAKCMREHGVKMPDPNPDGGFTRPDANFNPSDPKFQSALEACRSQLPSGSILNRKFDPADQERVLQLVKCVRDHGFNMPDPQFDAQGKPIIDGSLMRKLNFSDPKLRTAMQACRQFIPSFGGSGASGSASGAQ